MKKFPVRLDDDFLHYKFKYISEYEGRSANKQIIYLIHLCVMAFEKKHGEIEKPN